MAACDEKVCENHTQNIVGPDMNPDILRGMTGLELLKRVIKGEISHPSMATTIPMKLIKAEKGLAEFDTKADKKYLNPMGTIHGGFAAVVLDSVTGCAVHSMLEPGDTYGTIDLNVKLLRPLPMETPLKAQAHVFHCSNRLGVSEGTLKDQDGVIYAHATAVCMISRNKQAQLPSWDKMGAPGRFADG